MVNVRKRGKVYEYRVEIASVDGNRDVYIGTKDMTINDLEI